MNTKQREFILLRADGISFDKIAAQLKTSKQTLIQWSKLFKDEIDEVQFEAFLKIKEAYTWNKKENYEMLLKQLNKINEGINSANLTNTSIRDLFTIKNNILHQLETVEKAVTTNPRVTTTDELGYKRQLTLNLYEVD